MIKGPNPRNGLRAPRCGHRDCFPVICKQEKTFDMKDGLNSRGITINQL